MIPHVRSLPLILALASVAGCGIFGGQDDELPPTELLDFDTTLPVKRVWSAKLGGGSEALRLGLQPAGDGNRIYAASRDGRVSAFDAATGDRLWRSELDVVLSAGPGVGDGLVVVAGYDGDLIAMRADDGSESWRVSMNGESLSPPLVDDNAVIVYTIDGRLRVHSAFDGSERWVLEQSMPALTLRGASAPIIVGNTVVAGFDNGRLIATSLGDGTTQWEAMLSPAAGRSDLERLADLDGSIAAVGQDIYASGYRGRVASLAAESGQVLWARDMSTLSGVSADWNNVYVAIDDGEVVALLRRNGTDVWRQAALIRRDPTTPVPFHTAVAIGDFEGYVHFFNSADGMPVARVRVGRGMISGAPVTIGGRLYVQSESGVLEAYAVPEPEPRGDVPEIAADET